MTGANITTQVIMAINNLYGSTASSTTPNVKSRNLDANNSSTLLKTLLAPGAQYQEWIANVRVEKHALSAPFFVHIFLGPFNPDPFSWSFEPNLVGSHCVFIKAFSSMANCSSCNPDQLVSGTIPLTNALMDRILEGKLPSLDSADVEPYITKNLQYRITRMDDTEVGNSEVPSLKISIVSAEVQRPENDMELPKWGEMVGHMDVSTGSG